MADWITTHWPAPEPNWIRHVYVKEGRKNLPQQGDLVYVYEAKYATIEKIRVKTARRVFGGSRGPELVLPIGFGGIIGRMMVSGQRRRIAPTDVVYEYREGNLKEWSIIPCSDYFAAAMPIPHEDLVRALEMAEGTPPLPFALCKVRDNVACKLDAIFKTTHV